MPVTGTRTVASGQERELSTRAYIEAHRYRRHSNRVLHGHPSPLFWRNRDLSVPAIMAARAEALRDAPGRLNLYVATPYCLPTTPDRCGFCLSLAKTSSDSVRSAEIRQSVHRPRPRAWLE